MSGAGACKQAREAPGTATAMFGGWAADNKGCCSGSKLGIFDWRAMAASGAWSIPSFYNAQKNLKLISVTPKRAVDQAEIDSAVANDDLDCPQERMAREKAAAGPGQIIVPTVTPMGAEAFGGGRLRSEELFDVTAQLLANGATGVQLYLGQYADDPGILVAIGEALALAAEHADIVRNGAVASSEVVEVHSAVADSVVSAIGLRGRYLCVASPMSVSWDAGPEPPLPMLLNFTLRAPTTGRSYILRDLRAPAVAPVACPRGRCTVARRLSSSAVLAFLPAAA